MFLLGCDRPEAQPPPGTTEALARRIADEMYSGAREEPAPRGRWPPPVGRRRQGAGRRERALPLVLASNVV
jgi:hypothetical protein